MIEIVVPASQLGYIDGNQVTLFVSQGDKGGTRTEVWCYSVFGQRVPDTSPYIDDVPSAVARARMLGKEFGRSKIVMLFDDSAIQWEPEWQRAA